MRKLLETSRPTEVLVYCEVIVDFLYTALSFQSRLAVSKYSLF